MPTYTNGVLRAFPRVNVTRGYAGNEPQSITKSAPVATGETIYSGQPIALVSDEWVQADNTHSASQVFIAYHDSEDTDVVSCNKLLGFSILGEFEIETPWVNTDGISEGSKLFVNAANNLQDSGTTSGGTNGSAVVGYVTEIRDLGVGGHTAANARGGVVNTIPEDSTANGSPQFILQVTGNPGNGEALVLVDAGGATRTYTTNTGDDVVTSRAIGISTAVGASDNAGIATQIAASINGSGDAFQATANGDTVTIVQTDAGADPSVYASVTSSALANVTVPTGSFTRGPARWIVKFVTSAA
jgi:hypothetical protein